MPFVPNIFIQVLIVCTDYSICVIGGLLFTILGTSTAVDLAENCRPLKISKRREIKNRKDPRVEVGGGLGLWKMNHYFKSSNILTMYIVWSDDL